MHRHPRHMQLVLDSLITRPACALIALVGCGRAPEVRDEERRESGRIAGSEAGNPPVADQEVCLEHACMQSGQRFVDALAAPLALAPLRGSCVEDLDSTYCECSPESSSAPRAGAFEWPQLVSSQEAERAERGCLVWTRLAAALPELRSDAQQCLLALPEWSACEPGACADLCRRVHDARKGDAAKRYRAELRSASCGDPASACAIVFELEGRCYAKLGAVGVESQGPFDCELSDREILDQALSGGDEPAPEPEAAGVGRSPEG